jgi:hypothetical protein
MNFVASPGIMGSHSGPILEIRQRKRTHVEEIPDHLMAANANERRKLPRVDDKVYVFIEQERFGQESKIEPLDVIKSPDDK